MVQQKIGRYEIIRQLGRGGMAAVYQARDTLLGRNVAIKIIHPELSNNPQFSERFLQEAQMLAGLHHPGIIAIHDIGESNGSYYLVLPLLKETLTERIAREGSLSLAEVCKLMNQIAPAVDYAHQNHILHRDLKPSNILFDANNVPYINDFGIAKLLDKTDGQTRTGMMIGTPNYMSPEQVRGRKDIGPASDIYSLGAIVFQLLSGKPVFDGDSDLDIAFKHTSEPVPNILEYVSSLPPAIQSVLEKAMAKQPTDRYASAVAFANALETAWHGTRSVNLHEDRTLLESADILPTLIEARPTAPVLPARTSPPIAQPQPAPTPAVQAPPSKPKPSRWVWLTPLLILLVIGLGAGGYWGYTEYDKEQQRVQAVKLAQASNETATAQTVLLAGQTETALANTQVFVQGQTATADFAIQQATQSAIVQTASLAAEQTLQAQATQDFIFGKTQTVVAGITLAAQANEATAVSGTETAVAVAQTAVAQTATAENAINLYLSSPKAAFFKDNEIWVVNLDGSELTQLTTDRVKKSSLRWFDQRTLTFIAGLCFHQMDIVDKTTVELGCLNTSTVVEGFERSPDGKYFAISADDTLYVGEWQAEQMAKVQRAKDLQALANCFRYLHSPPHEVRWANDAKRVALLADIPWTIQRGNSQELTTSEVVQLIKVECGIFNPDNTDEFPGTRFTLPRYKTQLTLGSFGWDGVDLFSFTDSLRNNGFGDLWLYNAREKGEARQAEPLGTQTCCYRDLHWNSEGSMAIFAWQNITDSQNAIQLYTIASGSLYQGGNAQLIPLPEGFFADPKSQPFAVLSPLP